MTSQIAIITGAARGIGYGIADCLAKKGMNLVIADLNQEQAQSAASKLQETFDIKATGLVCDVSDRQSVESMVRDAVAAFGRIDVLVNNAGICPFIQAMEMTTEEWNKTMAVNATGAFQCTQVVARQMIEQGDGGRIVFITSLATDVVIPSQVDYGASKAAMRMTMVGFATALGKHGITCNAVAPGMILTDMTRHHWEKPGPAEMIKTRVPMGRIGTPTDVGHAVSFLTSPEADYVSGITIRVDGGHQAVCN